MAVELHDLRVLCVVAPGGLDGIGEAWAKLEARLPSLRGRRFYGTYLRGEYRACVVQRDDPAALGLETWTIPGGAYARRKLAHWREHTAKIGGIFAAMAAEHPVDPDRPSIEFYRSQDELILLLPIRRAEDRSRVPRPSS